MFSPKNIGQGDEKTKKGENQNPTNTLELNSWLLTKA
jgi:hypothetical protein